MTRRTRVVALLSAVSIVVAAFGFLMLHNTSTPLPVGKAVARFRNNTSKIDLAQPTSAPGAVRTNHPQAAPVRVERSARETTRVAAGVRPPVKDGVYVYTTKGSDHVDVLGGSTHTYPDETTMTVRHDGCHLMERWDALSERWDERDSCAAAEGDHFQRFTSHHVFFGHADDRTYTCTGFTYPRNAQPGARWTNHCVSGASMADTTIRAVAWETVVVGGRAIKTLHVHAETKLTGEQVGSSSRDVWGAADTGLTLRERATTRSTSSQPVFGKTTYTESYDIRLTSTTPRT